ncbi:Scd6-like Sm domain-containing protein [Amylostereum chailletii]|nr:Scd6-like Sm domain-containing protein [Amylostereum chailletii]
MALSFIGKPISLISHSDVRYRGILAGIDPAASTIQLSNVYSMGTETRRPPAEFIPPVQEPYQYIIFRASEVKDLSVEDAQPQMPRRSVHDDPAVLGAGAPAPGYTPYTAGFQPPPVAQAQAAPALAQQAQHYASRAAGNAVAAAAAAANGSVQTAAASLETVERALGDLRTTHGGGRRGGGGARPKGELRVPNTDFDFASSNARFDKAALGGGSGAKSPASAEEGEVADEKEKEKEEKEKAYNPQKSFFDSLSSSTQGLGGQGGGPQGHQGGFGARGGRGRGAGRNRREEERERNVATFGEPGGVGLMGPGAYVGGWGGYGRRGGGRGRRNPQVQVGGR